jgi:hypothetical protein
MKEILSLLLTLSSFFAFAQIEMSPIELPYIFIGIENPVYLINKTDTLCKKKVETSSNVEVRFDKESCSYYIRPKLKSSNTYIIVNNQKIYFKEKLRIVPDPIWMMKPSKGLVRIDEIVNSVGISLILENFNYDVRIKVLSYRVRVIRNGEIIFSQQLSDARFSPKFKEVIKVEDNIEFHLINIQAPEGKRKINDIKFKLKN